MRKNLLHNLRKSKWASPQRRLIPDGNENQELLLTDIGLGALIAGSILGTAYFVLL